MKRVWKMLLMSLFALSALMGYAFADVAVGPMYAVIFGVPVLAVAIIVIVVVLIARTLMKARKQRDTAQDISCRHSDAESGMRKSQWEGRDPWDIKRD